MKAIKNIFLLLITSLCLACCDKDEDKIYLSSLEPGDLAATATNIVLTQESSNDIVLSLMWTKDALQISDPALAPIDVTIQTLQASLTSDFSGTVNESTETSLSRIYTGATLNTLAKNVGATSDVANNVYFRLAARTGNNMDPAYSNTVAVSITPYTVDMSVGYVLNTDKGETGTTLYSATSNGIYLGFMGATSWYNYYLREGDGTIWGNDGVDGTAFLLSTESTMYSLWFPGVGGCYYVDVNTTTQLWSSLLIPALTLSGDLSGEMTFDRPNVKWTFAFTAAQAGDITLQASGTGLLYNYSTGTTDTSALETPVAFAQSGENLTFGTQVGNITVSVPAAGDYTLVFDLSNPQQWTATVTSGGGEEPEPVLETLYMLGISEGEGDWNFNTLLRLYDRDNLKYAGVVNVNSPWGYQIALEDGNWDDVYKLGEGDATAGTLVMGSETNIPAPAAGGLHFFDVSLQALTYKVTAVGSEIYVAGLNKLGDEDWIFEPLPVTATPGVFSGSITLTQASDWGFKLYLLDGIWDYVYGGSNGTLTYQGPGITDDATLAPGTYTLTVDLVNATYSIN